MPVAQRTRGVVGGAKLLLESIVSRYKGIKSTLKLLRTGYPEIELLAARLRVVIKDLNVIKRPRSLDISIEFL